MCGIAGLFNFTYAASAYETKICQMLSSIRHRGPDEAGIYIGPNVALGSVRLSIIDLVSGQQPLSDEAGNYWIVYNGEIFNYIELRTSLEKKGIRFLTNSDTEVVVQMYANYGSECLALLNGQFSFCILDKKKQKLFLARDRVGIRPLYYWHQNNAFAFCSEIKGLFTNDQIERKLNSQSLSQVFTFWTTLSPNTPFENIYELPPGHFMEVNSSSKTVTRYWSMDFTKENENYNLSLEDAIEEFNYLFTDSVKIRLRADVPVGAYLSGGLDSSITTAFIHKINPNILNTFSISFEEDEFDESIYQKEAASYFNTNHVAFKCSSNEIAEYFKETIWHTEYPILRTAPTPMYLLSKRVRENNIKVVITGEGADEFLAGYNIFKEAKIRRFWAKEPDSVIRPKLLNKLYPYLPSIRNSNDFALRMFFGYGLTMTENHLYSHLLRWHNTSHLKNYFSLDLTNEINGDNSFDSLYSGLPRDYMSWSDLSRSQYLEASIFMSGYLLSSQGDRMSMGNSVEGRYPFLDYRLIEYCNKLPDRFKLNGLEEKFILKKLSSNLIPENIRKRPKQAYRAPIVNCFTDSSAPAYTSDMLSMESIGSYNLFDPQKVRLLISKLNSGKGVSEIDQMAFIGILSSQLLYSKFIDQQIAFTDIKRDEIRIVYES